jgi:hypothetical protein|tara:strand:- start:515 stop:667 length:153 start_codon:yes stop_codon:yes gene_type:complete
MDVTPDEARKNRRYDADKYLRTIRNIIKKHQGEENGRTHKRRNIHKDKKE